MKLSSKEAALIACFAALYVIISFIPVSPFPLIGGEGRIDASAVISLVIGLLLGPLLGGLAVLIGGIITPFIVPHALALGLYTFVPHVAAAMCAGALKNGKQPLCALTYLFSFIFFAFFPDIGPVWTWPPVLWFHIIALIIIASPLQSWATKKLASQSSTLISAGTAVTFLTSTVFSQSIGSIVFEILKLPNRNPNYWQIMIWQPLTFIYPIERLIITVIATVITVPILKALRVQGFKV